MAIVITIITVISIIFYCIKLLDTKIRYKLEIQMNNSIDEPWKNRMDVALVSQLPELNNGCEVTSLTMILNYKGVDIDKMTLANEMEKDNTELVHDEDGDIKRWGNPSNGFVGDVTGKKAMGYAIDPKPLSKLIERYYKGGYRDLTGCSIGDLEKVLSSDRPIVVWITSKFREDVVWVNWIDSNNNEVKSTFSTHAITLTGFDDTYIYYNDPLTNKKDSRVRKEKFIKVWDMMGRKALALN
ncbi:MAG: C39 family peptidase [Romboutsia sp.]|uniref:C39 family peptidase n=1 Tax=Romboutsia sp. TaxID=1965302 RepID=UPI003F3D236A